MRKLTLLTVLIVSSLTSFAQIDTLFWFAAPNVSSDHGNEPISLHFSTFSEAANITVDIPADPTFSPISLSIGANSYDRIVLDHHPNPGAIYSTGTNQFASTVQNSTPNVVSNKGIRIQSDAPITSYYEVLGSRCDTWISSNNTDADPNNDICWVFNTDIFSLKGNNAFGTEFYVPGQTGHLTVITDNWSSAVNGKNTIDFVATEAGSTTVTVTLPAGIAATGRSAGETFTVTLTQGQTFSIEALNDLVSGADNANLSYTLYS